MDFSLSTACTTAPSSERCFWGTVTCCAVITLPPPPAVSAPPTLGDSHTFPPGTPLCDSPRIS